VRAGDWFNFSEVVITRCLVANEEIRTAVKRLEDRLGRHPNLVKRYFGNNNNLWILQALEK
jgi:hypothetical protein